MKTKPSFSNIVNQIAKSKTVFRTYYLTQMDISKETAELSMRTFRDYMDEFQLTLQTGTWVYGYTIEDLPNRVLSGIHPYTVEEWAYFYWATSGIIMPTASLEVRKKVIQTCFENSYYDRKEDIKKFAKAHEYFFELFSQYEV